MPLKGWKQHGQSSLNNFSVQQGLVGASKLSQRWQRSAWPKSKGVLGRAEWSDWRLVSCDHVGLYHVGPVGHSSSLFKLQEGHWWGALNIEVVARWPLWVPWGCRMEQEQNRRDDAHRLLWWVQLKYGDGLDYGGAREVKGDRWVKWHLGNQGRPFLKTELMLM